MSAWVASTCFPNLDYHKGSRMEIRSYYWKVTLALTFLAVTVSARRELLHQQFPCKITAYWNETLQECVECNVCVDITLRPCEAHRNTLCGTVADLNIDWSWIRNPHKANHNRPAEKPRHYVELPRSWQETIREHDPHRHILRQSGGVPILQEDELGKRTKNIGDDPDFSFSDKSHDKRLLKKIDRRQKHKHHHHTTTTTPSPDDYNYEDDYLDEPKGSSTSVPKAQVTSPTPKNTETAEKESLTTKAPLRLVYKIPYGDVFYDYTVEHDEDKAAVARRIPLGEEPFSSVEALVWDWQAVVLVSAIATCVVFFIIVVIYTCYYTQQWRKIKKTFDSDIEELSLRLNLINGMGLEHLHDPSATPSKPLHLAHLIVQKQQEAAVNAALPGTVRPNLNLYCTATSLKKNNS